MVSSPALEAPTRPRVHDALLEQLVGNIVAGHYQHSDFPTEQALIAEHGISRPTVREVLKVLSAKGLITRRPRAGSQVQPPAAWDWLDPLILGQLKGTARWPELMAQLWELRNVIEPAAARLAATKATPAEMAQLQAALDQMQATIGHDPVQTTEADLAFHSTLMTATHNIFYQRLLTTLRSALTDAFLQTNDNRYPHSAAVAAHGAVLEAITRRNPEAAEQAMREVLHIGREHLSEN